MPFALDTKLAIAGGFHDAADFDALRKTVATGVSVTAVQCGGDFSSGSVGGSTEGFGDASASGDGGGDGGGCGGGGD